MKPVLPKILLTLYAILFIALAINPHNRATWLVENIPIFAIVLILALTYKKFQFSNTSYIMMSFLIALHTIGGHYTFALVPFDFVTNLFDFSRNHFDRIAHFTVGFYAYPIAEFLHRKDLTKSKWILFLFSIFAIVTVAAGYEIIEWIYAALSDPAAGAAFLGSQGDIWDAQKDMLADTLGAIFATIFFFIKKSELKLNRIRILKFSKNKNKLTYTCPDKPKYNFN